MAYRNTFITVSDDSKAASGIIPLPRNNKPTIASVEYELIINNPYLLTQEEVQFQTYLIKNQVESDQIEEVRNQFFAKPKPCFRASPLVKKYGWGIHYDGEGRVAIYEVNSEDYNRFLISEVITLVKGMRSKRV